MSCDSYQIFFNSIRKVCLKVLNDSYWLCSSVSEDRLSESLTVELGLRRSVCKIWLWRSVLEILYW